PPRRDDPGPSAPPPTSRRTAPPPAAELPPLLVEFGLDGADVLARARRAQPVHAPLRRRQRPAHRQPVRRGGADRPAPPAGVIGVAHAWKHGSLAARWIETSYATCSTRRVP